MLCRYAFLPALPHPSAGRQHRRRPSAKLGAQGRRCGAARVSVRFPGAAAAAHLLLLPSVICCRVRRPAVLQRRPGCRRRRFRSCLALRWRCRSHACRKARRASDGAPCLHRLSYSARPERVAIHRGRCAKTRTLTQRRPAVPRPAGHPHPPPRRRHPRCPNMAHVASAGALAGRPRLTPSSAAVGHFSRCTVQQRRAMRRAMRPAVPHWPPPCAPTNGAPPPAARARCRAAAASHCNKMAALQAGKTPSAGEVITTVQHFPPRPTAQLVYERGPTSPLIVPRTDCLAMGDLLRQRTRLTALTPQHVTNSVRWCRRDLKPRNRGEERGNGAH